MEFCLSLGIFFCINPKSNGKILLAFCQGSQSVANFWFGLQNDSTLLCQKWFTYKQKYNAIASEMENAEITLSR